MNKKEELEYKKLYSHFYQIYLVKSLNPKEILEIGVGNEFVTKVLKQDYYVTTVDIDKNKNPDWIIDISNIDELKQVPDNFFDLILICEVLEHIPYEQVGIIIDLLWRKTKEWVVLSVPNQSKYLHFAFSKHGVRDIHFFMNVLNWGLKQFNNFWDLISKTQYRYINKKRKFKKQKEHKWELGIDRYDVSNFKKLFKRYYNVYLDERVKEFPWHHFFILRKIPGRDPFYEKYEKRRRRG